MNIIKDKGVQLAAISLPGQLWSCVLVLIPALFVYYSIATADSFKTNFYEEENTNAKTELENGLLKTIEYIKKVNNQ